MLSLVVFLSLPARGAIGQQERSPSGVKVGLQIGAGTIVAPVAFVVGGLATKWVVRHAGANEVQESRAAYAGAWGMTGLATAAVPPLLVRGGNYPAALAGTAIGGAAAGVMVWAGRTLFHENARCAVLCTSWGIVTFALPAAGATLLYNRSR
jgi:hypothetical protein